MKKKLLIPFIVDLIIGILLIIKYSNYLYLFVAINIVLLMTFVRIYAKISIININKLLNIIKTKKIRKQLSSEERYVEKMNIETFDGSGGTTHPCIMYFPNGFNGYKYYMVHTPYDNHNVEYENPSLCVSNDGFNFFKPEGVKDPLLPVIKQNGKILKYYNDNFLLYDDNKLQIWYRYTEEDKSFKEPKLKNKIYRITSSDGVHYSNPELMIDDDGIWYLSSSIVKINKEYYLYYFDKDGRVYFRKSTDLKKWSKPCVGYIDKFQEKCWHGEVKLIDNKLYLLFLSKGDYKLYFCEANIDKPNNFANCQEIVLNYYDKCNIYGNVGKYKSTFLIDDKYIYLYVPFRVNKINWFKIKGIKHIKWTMTYTKLKKESFNKYIRK